MKCISCALQHYCQFTAKLAGAGSAEGKKWIGAKRVNAVNMQIFGREMRQAVHRQICKKFWRN